MISVSLQGYILAVLVAGVVVTQVTPQCPRHRGLPDGFSRAENKFRTRALFRLDLRSAIQGFLPEKEYRFRVQTTARKFKFNDATVSIDALDEKCGAGSWMTKSDGLYSPKGCPSIVTTQQKQPMGRAHFKWRAPSCGCVHFRVRVHANSTYYLEDEDVYNGPLARTICPQASLVKSSTDVPSTTTLQSALPKVLTRNERLQLLCDVTEDHGVKDVMKNKDFMSKRTMSKMNSFEIERLSVAVERRHLEILSCCNMTEDVDRNECFDDVRRIRIDTFCGSGEPDIPLTKRRYNWIKEKQSECCPEIGESRYKCFNHTLYKSETIQQDGPDHHTSNIDMDDFDPINYVEDYPRADEIRKKLSKNLEQSTKADEHTSMTSHKVQYKQSVQSQVVKTTTTINSNIRDDENDNDDDNIDDDDEDNDVANGEDGDSGADDGLGNENHQHKSNEKPKQQSGEYQDNQGPVEEDISAEVDQLVDESRKNDDVKKRYLSLEECCMNGIDAGTRVMAEGFAGCFKMADKFDSFFTKWSRKCDRHFVLCCMRVIDGETNAVSKYTHLRHHNLLHLRKYTSHDRESSLNDKKFRLENMIPLFDTQFTSNTKTKRFKHLNLADKSLIIKLKGKNSFQKQNNVNRNLYLKQNENFKLRDSKRLFRKYRKIRKLQKKKYRLNSQNQTYKTNGFGYS